VRIPFGRSWLLPASHTRSNAQRSGSHLARPFVAFLGDQHISGVDVHALAATPPPLPPSSNMVNWHSVSEQTRDGRESVLAFGPTRAPVSDRRTTALMAPEQSSTPTCRTRCSGSTSGRSSPRSTLSGSSSPVGGASDGRWCALFRVPQHSQPTDDRLCVGILLCGPLLAARVPDRIVRRPSPALLPRTLTRDAASPSAAAAADSVVAFNAPPASLHCTALWAICQLLGSAASGFSSINLSLRT
jgi:hypothetical protein